MRDKLSFLGRFENIKIFAVKLRIKILKSTCFQQRPFINWLGSEFKITEKVFLETKSHQDTWKEGLTELSLMVALIFTELHADIGHLVWHLETTPGQGGRLSLKVPSNPNYFMTSWLYVPADDSNK